MIMFALPLVQFDDAGLEDIGHHHQCVQLDRTDKLACQHTLNKVHIVPKRTPRMCTTTTEVQVQDE